MSKKHQSNTTPNLINENEAAAILGLSPVTLRRWRWEGRAGLQFIRCGGAVRYAPTDIDAFIEAGRCCHEPCKGGRTRRE